MNPFETMQTCLKGPRASDEDIDKIPQFLFLRWLSGDPRTLMIANELNKYDIPIALQYDIIRSIIHNKIKFIRYPKSAKATQTRQEDVEALCLFFKINPSLASEYLNVIDKNELQQIKNLYKKGEA